jgi:hypothetical protein
MDDLEIYILRREVETIKQKLTELIEKFNSHTHEITTETTYGNAEVIAECEPPNRWNKIETYP